MTKSLAFALASLLLAPACSDGADPGPPEVKSDLARDQHPNVTDAQLAELVGGNTELAADLYRQVAHAPGNLFLSPHSISTALAMTYAGAKNQTAAQMATTLHFTLPPDDLFAAQNALDLALASRAHDGTSSQTRPFALHTASSIWGQTGKSFVADFLDTLAVDYGAGLYVLDFADDPEGSRGTINDWVAQQTAGKITDVLPQGSITNATALVLTNAIYFDAAWATPFDTGETADRPFFVEDDAAASVASVHGIVDGQYAEGAGWKAGELPYDGGKLAMTIVVPDDLASFEANLTAAQLASITGALQPAALDTTLPKFRFASPFDLGDALKALGMTDAFTSAADFSGIDGMRDLLIAKVLHKGFVAVDEAGTEAAAATAVVVEPGSVQIPSHTLTVDRPFLFVIRDLPTGEILFVGRVTDPRA